MESTRSGVSASVVLAAVVLAAAVLAACGSSGPATSPIGDVAPARVCPTHLDMELIGANSRFDPGWSGGTHGVGLSTGSTATVEILDCDDDCRRCRYRGPVRGDPAVTPVITQRCLNDLPTTCTADAECGANGPCRFMFPLVSTNVIIETCALTYFEPTTKADPSPLQGVIDLVTGESDILVFNLVVKIALEGCRDCQGDPSPFDGDRGGTCAISGAACDVNGIGTAIASQTSFDCPPASAWAFEIAMPGDGTTTGSHAWTMDSSRPMCTANGATAKRCWCGMCNDGTACTANSDCATGACGATTSPMGAPYSINNHACGNGTCTWDPMTQRGTCSNAPTRKCFPDTGTIVARGVAENNDGFFITQLANLVCMPSFDGGAIDTVGGFPGPLFFEARFRVVPRTVAP